MHVTMNIKKKNWKMTSKMENASRMASTYETRSNNDVQTTRVKIGVQIREKLE